MIDGAQVSIDSGCPAATGQRKRTRSGTRLVARWKSCGSLTGPVRLVVELDGATCESLSGRFKGRKVRRTFAAHVETPSDAFGRARDPLPPGAVLLTQEQWNQATQRPDFRSIDPNRLATDRAAEDQLAAADAHAVTRYVTAHPDLAPSLLGGVDPNDPAVTPGDDGDYVHTLSGGDGNPLTVSTLGSRGRFRFLATSLTRFSLAGIDPALPGQYPTPSQASSTRGPSTTRRSPTTTAASAGAARSRRPARTRTIRAR